MAFKWTTPRTWVASEVVTASMGNEQWRDNSEAVNRFVRKTADESLNTNITVQDDNHLSIAIPQAGTYVVECIIVASSAANAAGDIKFGFTFPTGTLHMFGAGLDTTLASGNEGTFNGRALNNDTASPTATAAYGLSTTPTHIRVTVLLIATASGTLTLQWAQSASNANNTTVHEGSFMLARQVA